MIVYGSGNADGNRHTHTNLPIVLAGGGGGTLTPGRYVKHGSKPMTNLFLEHGRPPRAQRPRTLRRLHRPARRRLSDERTGPAPRRSDPTMLLTTFALLLAAAALGCGRAGGDPALAEGAPGFEGRRDEPEVAKDYWVRNIHNPSMTAFLPPKDKATGAAVIICPGGGHRELVFNAEGVEAARYLNSLGVAAFALKYRLGREKDSPYKIDVHAREDGLRAMRLVRSRAAEWGIDPKRVGIMGFSAGGEVASMVAYSPGEGDPDADDPIDRLEQPSGLPDPDLPRPARHPGRGARRTRPRRSSSWPTTTAGPPASSPASSRSTATPAPPSSPRLRPGRPCVQHGEPVEAGDPEELAATPRRVDER